MVKLLWDQAGKKLYETGTSHGILSTQSKDGTYAKPVSWDGLIGVSKSAEGGDENPIYANNTKYLSLRSNEEAKGTITAYTYPKEFRECDGSKQIAPGIYAGQQARKPFGLAYETNIGNDVDGQDFSRTMHLLYGCTASPSDRDYKTINNDPEAMEFSWEYTTTPMDPEVDGIKALATIEIIEHEVGKEKYKKLQDALWGTESTEPKFLTPKEVFELLKTQV